MTKVDILPNEDAVQTILNWRGDPVLFVEQAFGIEMDVWQQEEMRNLVTEDRIAIRSGHGIGKSAWLAWIIIWWMLLRDEPRIACTAPTSHQLNDVLWGEIAKWVKLLPPALRSELEVKNERVEAVRNPKEFYCVARTARKDQPEAFQGFHCLSEDHDILTRDGWKGIDEISELDEVLSVPLNGEVAEWMPVERVHRYPFVGELNVYDGKYVSFAVTDEHRFPTKYSEVVEKWKLKRFSEMASQFMVRRRSWWRGEDFSVPDIFAGYSKEDFARFIGLWLSEGGVRPHSNGKATYEVLIYQTKPKGCEYIESVVKGFKYYNDFYYKSDRKMAEWLLTNCGGRLQKDRCIPDFLKNAPNEVLEALIEALFVGDGHITESGQKKAYYSTSKRLMDDVQEVLVKLGRSGSLSVNRIAGTVANSGAVTQNTAYVLGYCNSPTDHIVKKSNIRREPYSGRVWCISTPYQTFYTRRNGKVFLSGNSGDMLFIVDEASGVDDIIFQVGEGAMSTKGAKTVMTGNPTRTSGYFFDAFHRMRHSWHCRKVSCTEAKMVDPAFAETMAKKYGVDSNVYRVRVEGDFPAVDDDAVISLDLCESANGRDVGQIPGEAVWGVDVARFGDDTSCLAKRRKNVLLEPVKEWKGKDIMQTAGIVMNEWNNTPRLERPHVIMVDSIGLGAGVLDRLKELGLPARGVNVSESPSVQEKFLRLRDELWWKVREWLEERDCKLADDPELIGELTSPKYQYTSAGKIQIESKHDMKKRGVASPNRADAFMMTFAASDSSKHFMKPLNYQKVRWV